MNVVRGRSRWLLHVAAICTFALAVLWTSRAVLEHPATVVTFRLPANALSVSDLRQNVAQIAYASRSLWTDPRSFFDGQMCYPTGAGVSLGEHMLGEGVLGLPARLLWNDPVVTFNFVVAVRPLIGAVSMYALAYYWTGSFAAALIAGFAFGFHPVRLRDLIHPSVVGNELIPAILLSMHLLFTRRRWWDAVILSVLAAFQMLESIYVLMQLAIAVGIYGTHLLWRNRRTLLELLPKLAVVAAPLAVLAAWLFGPYLEARELWGVHQGRAAIPIGPDSMSLGHRYYPGSCLLLLAALGLLDRLRGARTIRGDDPRVPMALIAVVAIWFVFGLHVPWTQWFVRPLRVLLQSWIPGLDAGRAPSNALFVAAVSFGLLAAYGVRALSEKIGPIPRAIVAGIVAIACVAEVFVPALAKRSFGISIPEEAFHVRPPESDVAAMRDLPPGPVVNYPIMSQGWGAFIRSKGVLLAAYHEHKVEACMTSFKTPVQLEIETIANRLPSASAAQDLWTLGFRTIIFSGKTPADQVIQGLSDRDAIPHLVPIGEGETIRVFELEGGPPITTDIASLSPIADSQSSRAAKDIELRFGMRGGNSSFRHPDPVQPSELLVTWNRDGTAVASKRLRALLPLALAPGHTAELVVEDRVPPNPGFYIVTLKLADDPSHVVGTRYVVVPHT